MNRTEITRRIPSVVTELLTEKGYVAPVDVFIKLGWLKPKDYEAWRFRKVSCLERVVSGNLNRLSFTMRELQRYARSRDLKPSWTAYVSWGSGRRQTLQFSRSGLPGIERAYATHWLAKNKGKEEGVKPSQSC